MACKTTIVGSVCLNVGEKEPRKLDLTDFCAKVWRAGGIYGAGDRIRPADGAPGFEFEAGGAGQTGRREPKWPTTLNGTIADGSITWTARAISNNSLARTISDGTPPVWSASPATGLVISGEAHTNTNGEQSVVAYIDAQAAGSYEVKCHVTFSDTSEEDFVLEVTVE